ncbi:NGG1 interacting factor Nif3 [Aspergillus ochraceoroseus]|uniref:NGG1 interacting factor Nif3 n=1 Tax=Aspergillus ochraceoroseus TaxID=138278 RepID=A0A0F8UZV1_9EURO|nr:NGG1 interacting factor Nif3 [Aspergillus ochraceoroseus]
MPTDVPEVLLEAPYNHTRRQRNSVLLTIDLTKAVADEAIARKDSVVVAYHPIIFRGLRSLTFNDPQQQSLLRLAQEGISVYSPHTAVDATPGGMGDWLCDIVTDAITPSEPTPAIQKSSSQLYSQPTYPRPGPVSPSSSSSSASVVPHTRSTIHPSPPPVPEGMESAGMGRLVTFDTPQPLTAIIDRIARGVGAPGGIPVAIPQSASVDTMNIRTVGVCPGSGSSILLKTLSAIEGGAVVVALAHSNTERGYLHAVMRGKLEEVLKKEWEASRAEGAQSSDLREIYNDSECMVHVSEKDRDPYGIMIRQA